MAKIPNDVETLPKIFYRLSRVHARYRQMTDDRQRDDRRTGDSI